MAESEQNEQGEQGKLGKTKGGRMKWRRMKRIVIESIVLVSAMAYFFHPEILRDASLAASKYSKKAESWAEAYEIIDREKPKLGIKEDIELRAYPQRLIEPSTIEDELNEVYPIRIGSKDILEQ